MTNIIEQESDGVGSSEKVQCEWFLPIFGIFLALALALGIGFIAGQNTSKADLALPSSCKIHSQEPTVAECLQLRSVLAAEGATSAAQWSLWLSFGLLLAGSGTLVGLIVAFRQGQRAIAIATDANNISLANSQAQSRAYLTIKKVECKLCDNGSLVCRAEFHNSGNSPARQMRWLYAARLEMGNDGNEPIRIALAEIPDLDQSHWRRDIPAADTWLSYPLAVGDDQTRAKVLSKLGGASFLTATVRIVSDFRDVFGCLHVEAATFQGIINQNKEDGIYAALERAKDDEFC